MSEDGTALTGTAVNEVAALAQRAAAVQQMTIGGYEFADRTLARVNVDPRLPAPLEFYTLAGLVAYLKAEGEDDTLVHVVSPTRVDAVSRLAGEDRHLRRHTASAICKTAVLQGFRFMGRLDWIVVGGESGPGHRPMELAWLEQIAAQCDAAKVPLYVKQDSGSKPDRQGRIPDALWARKAWP